MPRKPPSLLSEVPNPAEKALITSSFFGSKRDDDASLTTSYYNYYTKEIGRLRIGVAEASCPINTLAAKTHEDIVHIVDTLHSKKANPRNDVTVELLEHFPGSNGLSIDRSVDLAVRLWLMLNVGDEDLPAQDPQKVLIPWEDETSLEDLIARQFRESISTLGLRERRLDPNFTAANMVTLCGLQLRWADCLEDHLRLDRRDKALWIFPYKGFLSAHLRSTKGSGSEGQVYSRALLRETIITLNLLFPQWDPQTQDLLQKHGQTFHTTGPFLALRRLDLHEFSFWRDQLFELYEEVYLAPADSWRQLWVDRRNPYQWYTFWVALIVLFLSLVSCALSTVQAWASVKALGG